MGALTFSVCYENRKSLREIAWKLRRILLRKQFPKNPLEHKKPNCVFADGVNADDQKEQAEKQALYVN